MNLNLNKENALKALAKKISEGEEHEKTLLLALAGINKVKHLAQVNKRVITAIKAEGISASLSLDYTKRLNLFIEKRVYKTSKPDSNGVSTADYYSENMLTIYFNEGYTDLIDNVVKRMEGITEYRARLEDEYKNIDALLVQAEKLQAAYNAMDDKTYVLKLALGISH